MMFTTGDLVWITCEGRTVEGEIILASENNVSLALGFEAILAGHVGKMPVLLHDDGKYRSLIGNVEVAIRKRESGE
ncbi:MAG TPA: hypothetical protein VEY94_10840 [Patescibacteria group bacterium]|nr:hypothetical protein [Patescibacteria group bacterium]